MPAEEFTEPEPNVIASNVGFYVKVLGRTGMRYVEGERSIWIDSEVLAKPRAIAISVNSLRIWDTPAPEKVSAADRDRVVRNLKRAFDARGYDLEVIEPFDWDSVALRRPDGSRE